MGRVLGAEAVRRIVALLGGSLLAGCTQGKIPPSARGPGVVDAAPWVEADPEVVPRPGMVWIPGGVLIAGTPPEKLPRIADEEMPGEQVVLHGFFIDVFPYPNELGAIPETNFDAEEARALCEHQGKRLCSELELERACKGPGNTTYEFGDVYRAKVCTSDFERVLAPNGLHTSCESAFGVHDLHGGAWSWTASSWRRDPNKTGLVAVRGGDGSPRELVGRCAHGKALPAIAQRDDVGVRCCAGEPNTFEVILSVTREDPLRLQTPEASVARQLEGLATVEFEADGGALGDPHPFQLLRSWMWHPLGNEEFLIGGGCAGKPRRKSKQHAHCGIVVARMKHDVAVRLAWVASDYWEPTLSIADSPRELFVYGGDANGGFRRRVAYDWGKVVAGPKERRRKKHGESEPSY